MKQRAHERCRQCKGLLIVRPTPSPWEFETHCACGHWLISFAHRDEPPEYEGPNDEWLAHILARLSG